ncbi:hypothetical protein E1A91_A13G013900v1 [Gossypium mustelinum]|uniref:glutathione transferase n=1 Tax=Gossypium mustelinum TaxID=34275 RepID=A0A5D2WEN8_GOSMU|nr:hypothetical protein E1A91_A13G013900v1 [Gossypium mustelinum]
MSEGEVKVLGIWASPFSTRVRIALHLKSVNYDYLEEKSLESKSELLLDSNPVFKRIPVLIHGDNKPISESLIIVEYIDEVWSSGPSILPCDAYQRADARFWATYVDDKFYPALKRAVVSGSEETKRASMAEVEEGVAMLEKLSKGEAFFGGYNIGYLDIVIGSVFEWIKVIDKCNETQLLSQAETPCLLEWGARFSSHEAVKDVLPGVAKLAGFGLKLKAKI